MKISKTLKKGTLLLALIFPLVTHSGWASDSDEEGGCCGRSSRNERQITSTERSRLVNEDVVPNEEEPGCCYWVWYYLCCGSDDEEVNSDEERYIVPQQQPYGTTPTPHTFGDKQGQQKKLLPPSTQTPQPYAILSPHKTTVRVFNGDTSSTFPLRQQDNSPPQGSPTQSLVTHREQQVSSIKVDVNNIVPNGQGGFQATITPVAQPQPLTIQSSTGSSKASHRSASDSDESFSEETLTRMELEEKQQNFARYQQHFESLQHKKYPNEETLRSIHKSQDIYAVSRLLLQQTSEGHYLDLTRVCSGMDQFFEITLPQEVITLSGNADDGFTLQGNIDEQILLLNSKVLQLDDIKHLQRITQINGKALILLIKEIQGRVKFKNLLV